MRGGGARRSRLSSRRRPRFVLTYFLLRTRTTPPPHPEVSPAKMESLIGTQLFTKDGRTVALSEALGDAEYVAVYFSAHCE